MQLILQIAISATKTQNITSVQGSVTARNSTFARVAVVVISGGMLRISVYIHAVVEN
jgi:hypothetical protein